MKFCFYITRVYLLHWRIIFVTDKCIAAIAPYQSLKSNSCKSPKAALVIIDSTIGIHVKPQWI